MTTLAGFTTVFCMDITIHTAMTMIQAAIDASICGAQHIRTFTTDMTMTLRASITLVGATQGTHIIGTQGLALLLRSATDSTRGDTFRWKLIWGHDFPTI